MYPDSEGVLFDGLIEMLTIVGKLVYLLQDMNRQFNVIFLEELFIPRSPYCEPEDVYLSGSRK
jgi:hypothetical protein